MDQTGSFHSPYGEQAEKQGEHDILIGKFQDTAVKGKIEGNFRDQGKEKKAKGIFFSVGGVKESFHQQKTENRESQPSDAPQHLIDLGAEKAGGIGESRGKLIVIRIDHPMLQDHGADMVDEHEDKSK